jgi:hypothetical protein
MSGNGRGRAMLRFLTDEDFDGRLTSALLARVAGLDLVRAQNVGLLFRVR